MQLIFATNNKHKIEEVQRLLSNHCTIISPADLGILDDIPENEPTLEGNALEKARYLYKHLHKPCFADDTGLEVAALGGAPGVYSARYAGESKDPQQNTDKLLRELESQDHRAACFRCVIALIEQDGTEHLFEGRVDGEILRAPSGNKGFGYDPVFRPEGYDVSFAEMGMDEKNKISHRGKAVEALVEFLVKKNR